MKNSLKFNFSKIKGYLPILWVFVGLFFGWVFFGASSTSELASNHQHEEKNGEIWTCSMHPQIRKTEAGKCPICGMDLIPLGNNEDDEQNPMAVQMSATAMKLANIQTYKVESQNPVKELKLNGKVRADERLIYAQSSHIPGRIERLMINFTGEAVSRGQVLAMVYSPDLITAQEELFEAQNFKESQPALFNAAKEKLKNWKLTDAQIENILKKGTPQENFPILADVSGTITGKKVSQGDYITRGMPIYEVSDLSRLWVLFDVYESDMSWVRVGSEVEYTVQSIPGKTFKGIISFIDPLINPQTRVATARVEIVNVGRDLKPEMFVSGIIKTRLQVKENEIVIPKTAVMWTGERSVVYIKTETAGKMSFMLREITLGPSLGDAYVIKNGLETGEEIVVNGTFTVDAAAQLAGKPSMMSPEGGNAMTGHNHGQKPESKNTENIDHSKHNMPISLNKEAKVAIDKIIDKYLILKNALVKDDLKQAQNAAQTLKEAITKTDMTLFQGNAHTLWMDYEAKLQKSIKIVSSSKKIDEARKEFINLSKTIIEMTKKFGTSSKTLFVQHCPMADNDKGADWLSEIKEIKNPYFGAAMLGCGSVEEEIKAKK